MSSSLAKRRGRYKKKEARVAKHEGKLKNVGCNADTLRVIKVDGLIEEVGLLEIDSNVLLGAPAGAASPDGRS